MLGSVLYVDDDRGVLNAFRRRVRVAGYDVVACVSAAEALAMLDERTFDVVCSDYRMPEMDGITFLREATRRAPHAQKMMITAYHDFRIATEAVQVGVFRLVGKPWNNDVLLAHLADGVRTARLQRENTRLEAIVRRQVSELGALNQSLDLRLARRTDHVISALVTCLDYRDEETMAHSKRVSLFARRIAETMGLEEPELISVEWGAMLHDVGKIGVPDAILLKEGALTEAEWHLMRRHVSIGTYMIGRIDFLAAAARVVADHHERLDGSGYPHGRRGDDIYLGARIFAVADTFDAITSDRPYRLHRSDEVAFAELRRVRGVQLDPRCVDAFLSVPVAEVARIRGDAASWAHIHAPPVEAMPLSKGAGRVAVRAALDPVGARPS